MNFCSGSCMVTPQANKHHESSRIRDFTIILGTCWTSRFKIYKDLYSCPPDLWPVAGPSCLCTYIADRNTKELNGKLKANGTRNMCYPIHFYIMFLLLL